MPEVANSSMSNRTVDRALDILMLIAENNADGMIFSDIARKLGIPKSSISTILVSLVERRFLRYNAKEKSYYLGDAIFNLGNYYVANANILNLIEGAIEVMIEKTGYTSFFAVLSGNEVKYLLRKVSSSQDYQPAKPQYNLKASCTGVGKALLLDKTKGELNELFSEGMPKVTPNTITSTEVLYQQLLSFRKNEIVEEHEESSIGIQCRAIPIRFHQKIIAALSSSFPIWMNNETKIWEIEKALIECRRQIERIIASNPNQWVFSSIN